MVFVSVMDLEQYRGLANDKQIKILNVNASIVQKDGVSKWVILVTYRVRLFPKAWS